MRKIIDNLNKKIEMLKSKLERMGFTKIPSNDIEKKVFYSNSDKNLEKFNLINEVHRLIRKCFSVTIPHEIIAVKEN